LYNAILTRGHFPIAYKQADVILIPKPGKDKTNPANLRPISLTSVMGKNFERIINRRLQHKIETEELISASQAGFRPGKNTSTNLISIATNHALSTNSKKCRSITLSFDQEKAFDRMWHEGLVTDLLESGHWDPLTLRLIWSYLHDRRIRVFVNNRTPSQWKCTSAGTPQGGILSPTLYILRMEALLSAAYPEPMNPYSYADDLQLHSSNRTDEVVDQTLQVGLDLLEDTCREKRMKINPPKSGVLQVTRSRCPPPNLTIFGGPIPQVKEMKLLGVIFNSAGSASSHVKYLTKKTRNIVNSLRRLRKFPSLATAAYNCMLVPSVTYASAAWSASLTNDQLKQIRRIQDNAIKSMLGLPLWISSRYARAEAHERGLKLTDLMQQLTITARKELNSQGGENLTYQGHNHRLKGVAFPASILEQV
jgi:hypothetical protein